MPGLMTTGDQRHYIERNFEMTKAGLDLMQKNAIYPQIMEVGSDAKYNKRVMNAENMQGISRTPEDAHPVVLALKPGYAQKYTMQFFSGMVIFTDQLMRYDTQGLAQDSLEQLQMAAGTYPEIVCAAYLDYGDTLTGVPSVGGIPIAQTVGCDQLALFSKVHTWRQGGNYTFANQSAAASDLTASAIVTQYAVISQIKDNDNRPLDLQFEGLVVPPFLTGDAMIAIKSMFDPATNNNAINPAPKLGGTGILEDRWVSSQSRWFLKMNGGKYGLNFWKGQKFMAVSKGTTDPVTRSQFIMIEVEAKHGATYLLSLFLVG